MARQPLLDALKDRVLLCDGAMGTQLHLAGLGPGECGETWNLERPEEIEAILKRYAQAGADCLTTNTFGACAVALKKHGLESKAFEINRAAAEIARRAAGDEKYIFGDIGPSGELLEPFGALSEADLEAAYVEQAKGLIEGGADAIILETMMAIEELLVGVRAVRSVDGDIPLIASMAYGKTADGGYATMMGVRPEQQAAQVLEAGANIVACNCGTEISAPEHAEIVAEFRVACDAPLMTQPNAGKPEVTAAGTVFREGPDKMAEHLPALLQAGANIVGGCCGTTPEHIAAFRKKLDAMG